MPINILFLGVFIFLSIKIPYENKKEMTRNGEAVILVEEGVGLSKQVDKTSAASGETLTYTINYSNNTAGEVTNAKIEDPIPLGTTFVSAVNGGTSDGSKVIWNLGTIVAGGNGSVTFQVRIN